VPGLVHPDVEIDEDRRLVAADEREPTPHGDQQQRADRFGEVEAPLDVLGQ
jgi:hypothetical protein